jgi:hypothetical protein
LITYNKDERRAGNFILDHWTKDKLFINKLLSRFINVRVAHYGCTLFEVKHGELIRPIDYYIKEKHLDFKHKFDFKFKAHESWFCEDKKFTEFYYQSIFEDNSRERI